MKLKGTILTIAIAGVASAVILAGLAVNVASGAPTDVTASPTATTGNPPAAPIEPPATGTNPGGSQFGVNNGPGAGGGPGGVSNLPSAGLGLDARSGYAAGAGALVLLGIAGFALVTAGTRLSRKRGS